MHEGWGSEWHGVSGTYLLLGWIHSLWQVLGGLVHQLFAGQAPVDHGPGAATVGAGAGAGAGTAAAAHLGAQLQPIF